MSRTTSNLARSSVAEVLRLLSITPPHHTVMLWGPPGIGKTDVVHQYARAQGADVVTVRASEMEPQDLIGLPDLSGECTVFKPLRLLYDLTAEAETYRRSIEGSPGGEDDLFTAAEAEPATRAILFLDELSNAPPNMVATLQYLVLNRTVGFGGKRLADGVQIIAAGNREDDGAFTTSLSTPMKSRMKHVEFAPTLDDWKKWARSAEVYPRIIAFLTVRERFFHDFDPTTADHTFPCPRTWAMLSESLKLADAEGEHDPAIRRINAEGYVGPGAAMEYSRFEETAIHCPSAAEVVADPGGAPTFPDHPDRAMVTVENLISACCRDPARFVDGTLRYSMRLHTEFRTILHRALLDGPPEPVLDAVFASSHFGDLQESIGHYDLIASEAEGAVAGA